MKQVFRIVSAVCMVVTVLYCISSIHGSFICYATEMRPKTCQTHNQFSRPCAYYKNIAQGQWLELKRKQEQEWSRLKAQVEERWQEFVHSTRKVWVEYGWNRDVRSRVDFEKGRILLEAVVEGGKAARKKAQEKIKRQAIRILGERKDRILEGQVRNSRGEEIGPNNLDFYLEKEVLPRIGRDSLPYTCKDGVKRTKYSVAIKMVPDHLEIRAMRYLPIVRRNAERFSIMPELIMAIIHTESFFNPMAISPCGAIGLMQIIPRYAGREAYVFINKNERVVTPQYLLVPENNVRLGVAYLHLLKYTYFVDIKDEAKRRYFTICGYNWGPGAVRKNIIQKYVIPLVSQRFVGNNK